MKYCQPNLNECLENTKPRETGSKQLQSDLKTMYLTETTCFNYSVITPVTRGLTLTRSSKKGEQTLCPKAMAPL